MTDVEKGDTTRPDHVALTLKLAGKPKSKSSFSPGSPPKHLTSLRRANTNASILRTIDKQARVILQFSHVNAWVPTLVIPGGQSRFSQLLSSCSRGGSGSDAAPEVPKERQVLFDISGEVNPGEVLALMGPSGGGKTSLLTLLGGRSTARVDGAITFNGSKLNKPIKRKLGYVSQDDLLFAELTVYETLYFAALLRLPRTWSKADKLGRVEMVLEGLGLERCRDTIIGSQMMRGVSGGERKRVSIGHELLINPSLLLLDEPTSGLDSTTALRLMHTLRTLASGGRTIVTSIHQPSSRLYKQMDKLMLLSEGRCMYYGDAQCVSTWFKLLGQPCPFGTNIADHILDLANGDVVVSSGSSTALADMEALGGTMRRRLALGAPPGANGNGNGVEHAASVTAVVPAVGARDDVERGGDDRTGKGKDGGEGDEEDEGEGPTTHEVLKRMVDTFEKRAVGRGPGGITSSDLETIESLTRPEGEAGAKPDSPRAGAQALAAPGEGGSSEEDKWGASWFDQIRYLTIRCVKTRRFQSLSNQKFIQLIGVAVLSGCFWWQIGANLDSEQAVLDVGGLLFFMELFMGFASLFAALFTFPAEFQMLVKERQSGMYRLSAYYVARTVSDLPMDCLLPSIFTIIVYWMTGLRPNAGAFFANWASILLMVLTSQSVGLLIGATVMNPMNGQTIATIFMLATMLVGGYYVRGIPVWISWMKYVSFIYWGWNLLLKIEFSNRHYEACGPDINPAFCTVQRGNVFELDVDEPVTKEVCILIGMLIFLRLCIYYALKVKTTFKANKK
ncbi:hypothetical protein HYH03_013146 [Edaphochlamys debaryana]|uniref:ABC transporter domain-containing protein n=1 Tax=Edaphochlamys debaryana TaxID=47281 RepID=A0A835XQL5_9CHLO|nr:hypothetical protein HYH03_013146 [Edaphochlamys debaryana]|eukprot:KAG2488296.1 hypothetical protein HYH03_013146 [Edaphochlamys debaryana]